MGLGLGLGLSGYVGAAAAAHGVGAAYAAARAGTSAAARLAGAYAAYCASVGTFVAVAAHPSVNAVGALGKDARTGDVAPLAAVALLPYHVPVRAWARLKRHLGDPEPHATAVAPGVFLGAWPSSPHELPAEESELAVLDLTAELPRRHSCERWLCLPTFDTNAPTVEQIQQGVEFVLANRAEGRPVLVHCAHGHGRSATVLCAALAAEGVRTKRGAKTWREAEEMCKAARPRVRINARQAEALDAWAAQRLSAPLWRR